MQYYVEIKKRAEDPKFDDEVVKRMGPMAELRADKVANGASINLDHDNHYVIITGYAEEEQQPETF